MPHIKWVPSDTGQVDVTYWFEGLCVKRVSYDTLSRYLGERGPALKLLCSVGRKFSRHKRWTGDVMRPFAKTSQPRGHLA